MQIFIPKEANPDETRVASVPAAVAKLVKLGAEVRVEAGLGRSINFSDEDYIAAGAALVADRQAGLAAADLILRLGKPAHE